MAADATEDIDVRGRAVSGVLWSLLQRWSVRLSTLATFIVLGRLLEPRDFGLVALATALTGFVNIFSEVGLSTYVVQHRDLNDRQISTVFWSGAALGTVLAAAMAVASAPVAALLGRPDVGPVLAALSGVIVLTSFTTLPAALLKRELRFKVIAVRSVLATVVSCAASVGLAFAGAGVWSLVAQTLVFNLVSIVVLWSSMRWRPSLTFDVRTARRAMSYGSSVLGIQLVAQLRQQADVVVISVLAGPVVLGYYSVATRILATMLDSAVSVIATVANPVFARLTHDRARLQRAYKKAVFTSLALMAPLVALFAVMAPVLIPVVFGDKWEPSIVPAQWLALSGLIGTVVYFDRGLLIAVDRRGTELLLSISTTLLGIVAVATVAEQGLVAISVVVALRALLSWPLRIRVSSRVLSMPARTHVWQVLRICAAAATASVPGAVAGQVLSDHRGWGVAAGVTGFAAIYPCLLRVASPDSWRELQSVFRRARRRATPRAVDGRGPAITLPER